MASTFIQLLLSGAIAGSVYALLAIGLVLIHNGTGVVNFGFGDQLMVGVYILVFAQQFLGLALPPAILVAVIVSGLLGLAIQSLVMTPLRNRPVLIPIVATIAIGAALREGIRAFMGPNPWPVPFLLSTSPYRIGGISIVPSDLAILGTAVVIMLCLYVFFEFTKYGQAILAACANPTGALIVGIPAGTTTTGIWVLSSMLAAIAGIVIAPLTTLTPDIGLIAIKGFAAAVLGGFASLPGAVVGGILLGIIEALAGYYVSSAMKDIVSYAVLIGVIVLLPSGLFNRVSVRKV